MKFLIAVAMLLSMSVSVFAEENETNQNVHREYKTITLPCGRTKNVPIFANTNPIASSNVSSNSASSVGQH